MFPRQTSCRCRVYLLALYLCARCSGFVLLPSTVMAGNHTVPQAWQTVIRSTLSTGPTAATWARFSSKQPTCQYSSQPHTPQHPLRQWPRDHGALLVDRTRSDRGVSEDHRCIRVNGQIGMPPSTAPPPPSRDLVAFGEGERDTGWRGSTGPFFCAIERGLTCDSF